MAWVGFVGLGATLLLAVILAALGIEGLRNKRGPRNRYVRLLVIAAVLLAVAAALAIAAVRGWPGA